MKYLKELGIKFEDTPLGWNKGDRREEIWKEEREIYGFDERETWSLGYSFYLWLYQRLRMYDEVNRINTNFHEFHIDGETLTQQECIDRMIEGCEVYLKNNSLWDLYENEEDEEKVELVTKIWSKVIQTMWW